MNSITEKKGLFRYFSYKNEPGWFTVFIHVGFGLALLIGIATLILSFLHS